MKTQQAVVQYALTPMAVELRDVPVPDIGPADVLLKVGAVSVCGSDVHQAYATHSWPVNIPVDTGPRVRRHHRRFGTRGHGLQRWRPRRQRDGRSHLRDVPDVPHGPLQPVPDAQGVWVRRQRRDGRVRESAGTLSAPRTRHPAVRAGVPHRAALRGVQRDVRQRARSNPATASWCWGPGPSACCARGWRRCRAPIRSSSPGYRATPSVWPRRARWARRTR